MKFTNGYWKIRDGINAHFPAEIFEARREGNGLALTVACKPIRHRGDTLGGPFLNIGLDVPVEGVIRVRIGHFQGGKAKAPLFQTAQGSPETEVLETDECWTIATGPLTARISKKSWKIEYLSEGKLLTDTGFRNIGYMATAPRPDADSYWFNQTTNNGAWIKEELHLGVGESIFGLGERFTPFVRNGQSVELWNEDGGTSSELAYKNIPFYISSAGYGVFINDPGNVQFEIGSEKVSRCGFSVKGESLEYHLIAGPTPKEILRRYAALTGQPALPPQWSFGLWLTTSFTTNYDEASVSSVIQGMADRDLPLHVFHFDCFWMKGANWCDFRWDRDLFPDPSAMLGRLKTRFSLRICVWINSYIAQQSSLFADAAEKGYLVKKADGSVWQCDEWQPGMGLVDFTNPDACRWFQDRLSALCDAGVDCFKTDFGERIPTNVVWHDGSDPEQMHNYYTFLYNKTVFEVLEKRYGKGAAALFARSATAGSQQFPIHWGGDCSSNYDSMAETLRGGLSLGLSGFGFWSHDISGFEHQATPDLYKRWVAFGLLSSHSRLHGNSSHRVPWLFDDEASDVLRHFTKLKCRLMPYIFAKAVEARDNGWPVLRAMMMEFPENPACNGLDRQYMLGEALLVAPIFNDESRADYFLPEGIWTDLLTNERKQGGRWITEKHGYLSIPLMVRPGSVIPFGAVDTKPDYDLAENAVFHVFGPFEKLNTEVTIPSAEGKASTILRFTGSPEGLRVEPVKATHPWSVLLRGVRAASTTDNIKAEDHSLGVLISPASPDKTLTVRTK